MCSDFKKENFLLLSELLGVPKRSRGDKGFLGLFVEAALTAHQRALQVEGAVCEGSLMGWQKVHAQELLWLRTRKLRHVVRVCHRPEHIWAAS